jgi:hypothetical protein
MVNKNAAKNDSEVTTVFVYGYSSGNSPFLKEARTKKLDSARWSLLLNDALSCGQKLLLMDGIDPDPLQAEIVTTRSVGRMFEVQVAVTR